MDRTAEVSSEIGVVDKINDWTIPELEQKGAAICHCFKQEAITDQERSQARGLCCEVVRHALS